MCDLSFPSHGLPNVPGPVEPVGQSVRDTSGAGALALGATLATVGGAVAEALAEAAVPVFGSSLHATHIMMDKNRARFMARHYTWLALVVSLACGAAAPAPLTFTTTVRAAHPLVGKTYDSKTRAFTSLEGAEKAALDAPFVLLGEKHDNADHHRLQARALKSLVDHGRKPSVAFEMIDLDLQRTADAFTQSGSVDVDELGRALEWDKRGWPAWSFYRPIFEVVVAAHLKIVATGLSHDLARKVVREGPGALPEEIAERVKLVPLEPAAATSLDEEIKASHCGMLPDAMVAPMSMAQRVKDALMANILQTNATPDGAVLIAGNGHVRSDRGVPIYLRKPSITIGFVEVGGPNDAASYASEEPARFLVFTPRVDDEDPCKKFHSFPADTSSTSKIKIAFGGTAGGTPFLP
jgi:uncharacterized iron-regulated protein